MSMGSIFQSSLMYCTLIKSLFEPLYLSKKKRLSEVEVREVWISRRCFKYHNPLHILLQNLPRLLALSKGSSCLSESDGDVPFCAELYYMVLWTRLEQGAMEIQLALYLLKSSLERVSCSTWRVLLFQGLSLIPSLT